MRWDNLTRSGQDALFGVGDVVARTFDTPEFRGMTFYEVAARSILNKVPGASRVPFDWTLNPYRGCSHACRYCLPGDTPILMADTRSRPLAELRVGDAIYGTVRDGGRRRYTRTEVLAHWRTVKAAYRVTFEDGTELVASGDHRFLTDLGWKHVTGGAARPALASGDEVIGTGRFAAPPQESAEYRRGYLCGIVHGDPRRALGLVDREVLRRVGRYFMDAGARGRQLELQAVGAPSGWVRPSMRHQIRVGFEVIADLISWPGVRTDAWCTGFLAGIFDVDGDCCGGVLHTSGSDPEVAEPVISSLAGLGFRCTVDSAGPAGAGRVRLLGGAGEWLRFFHTVDPATSRKRSIAGLVADQRARVVSVEDLGVRLPMYDITTGTGDFIANGMVSHNCFARRTHEYLDLDAGADFDSKIVVKINAPELLRKELAAPRWAGEHIAMGTNVDPYQRAEGRYRLMPGILAALRDARNPFSVLTKGTLVLRDLDLLLEAAEVTDVSVAVSVGFLDETLWRQVEPGTPAPRARLGVCRALADAGIGCGVLMAPILPYLTDSPSRLDATVRAIAEAGARSVTPIVLHLRPGAREWYYAWLQREYPELVPRYQRLYAGGAYAPKGYQRSISARVGLLANGYGIGSGIGSAGEAGWSSGPNARAGSAISRGGKRLGEHG